MNGGVNDGVDGGAVDTTPATEPEVTDQDVDDGSTVRCWRIDSDEWGVVRVVAQGWTPRANLLVLEQKIARKVAEASSDYLAIDPQHITVSGTFGTGERYGPGWYWRFDARLLPRAWHPVR